MNIRLEESSRRIRAEAASWVARLHGPDRNAQTEAGLRRWLAQDPAHVRAFELATEVWLETAELPGGLPNRPTQARPARQLPWIATAAAAAATVVALFAYIHFFAATTFATHVGEQRTVTLPDGSRVELNTNSEIAVKYDERTRRVILKSGEAYFDVASNKERPFVVAVSGREVIALGTVFLVRRDAGAVTVTLLEGRVAVAPMEQKGAIEPAARDVQVLQAGQRLRIAGVLPPIVDTPAVEKVTAWQRGQLVFEDTPLAEAAGEFNRYSAVRVELASDELADIRVGGTFRVGDVSSFARAVADSNELEVIDRGREVLLIRARAPAL